MRKTLLALSAVLLYSGSFSQEIFQGVDARKFYDNAEIVRTSPHSNLPSYVQFYNGQELDLDDALLWVKKSMRMDQNMNFTEIRVDEDQLGHKHYRYRQTLNGVPIEAGTIILHTKNDKVYSINGNFYQNMSNTTTVTVSEESALEAAKTYIGAELYKWEMPEEEAHYKEEQDDEHVTYHPHGEVVMVSDDYSFRPESYRTAWKFNIYAHEPMSRQYVYVDAQTGEVIQEEEIIHEADEVGTAHTQYSGTQSIVADSFAGGYRLRDGTRGDGVRTFDMNTGTSYAAAVDFVDDDNDWNNVNPQLDEYATDAHYGAESTYDYYLYEHSRNSIDNAGYQLNSYVHYSNSFVNAFWDGTRMTYGDGNASYSPLVTMDIAGHEITHGLITNTANLTYSYESGALNESFADIFGTAVENYATPGDWDWLIGEDIGSAFRSMSNPNAFGDPDTYLGTNWWTSAGDSGGVHTNSGVQNFWYYVLNNGDTGTNDNGDAYSVTGQGWTIASAIAFRNLTVYLTESSQFLDARFYAIQSAVDLYGACTPEVEACTDAWYAVGVGPAYSNTVIADFEASPDSIFCSAPVTVDFTNLSVNAFDFEWDFGDGSPVSTASSPSHTYTDVDSFTVSLIADGGPCGADTTIKIDYIIIDTTQPCEIDFPTSGIGSTQTACDGTLYDSGGPSADYGANQDAQITIAPFGAASVDLTFISFDVEPGPSGTCNYDYLEIYDGPDATAPLIDRYCNNNLPPPTISSTGNSITLVFHSDPGLELDGFEIEWNCILPSIPPDADFMSDVDTTCTGIVNFTDLSTNGPTSWDWDFGDGGTSSDQNPTHTYTTSGLYTVVLTAYNGIGPDTETKVDYIFIDIPPPPAVENDTICEGQESDLIATGSGTIQWWDSPTAGTLLSTGPIYTTPTMVATSSFWVDDEITFAPVNDGKTDDSGAGGFFGGDQHLIFDVTAPCALNSVKVYADGGKNRTIELRNSIGEVLESMTIYIPDGEQTVALGWDLAVGNNYQLGTEELSDPDMYRNNAGSPTYPYNVSGLVNIHTSSAGDDYYYFFYDWELQEPSCISERAEVVVEVQPEVTVNIDPVVTPQCEQDAPQTVTTTATGGTWSADCGACIDASTGVFDPSVAGIGTWTVTYNIPETCELTNTTTIDVVDCLGVGENGSGRFSIYPNPTKGLLHVNTGGSTHGYVEVMDLVGKKVLRYNYNSSTFDLDLTKVQARSTYFVKVVSAEGEVIAIKKIVKK